MKQIYVCSALRGDIQNNVEKARRYCEFIVKKCGAIPIAPHIYFTQFLNDDVIDERKFGILAGLQLLEQCDELWYFGDVISEGMRNEIEFACAKRIPVKHVPGSEIKSFFSYEGGIEHEL